MSDDWKQAWQPLIDAVGTDFDSDVEVWGADEVERSTIRRFLEPLEFDYTEYAQKTGSPEMYANNIFLQGMWERTAREFIGLAGVMKSLAGFRMKIFNTVGETVITRGRVRRKWLEGGEALAELEIWSENSKGISVGPGTIIVALPRRETERGEKRA